MSKFYVVSTDILPDVLEKVIEARTLLQSGKVRRISEAVKQVGISRGTYYKYKDAVFTFDDSQTRKAVITMVISSASGSLSQVMNLVADENANVLAINQTIPINGIHTLSLTLDITELNGSIESLIGKMDELDIVDKIDLVAVE
ncbi:ACT domain-containing protein [Catenisphaera adipataccumulans]|jgi:chorismate mutase|uniref:UPF0735 ACT domain-containing protein HNQ47_000965 n=1 Tax=Catenisphaera adipataccumulans TaxID=700500 RepID=A0A7W8CZR5_9FIRM|nr:ACT domain-containing protein [Catenisphaera adipataccumulans]MBB5182945.1 chorismate mutase [Catenisphaera adipataccumulans]